MTKRRASFLLLMLLLVPYALCQSGAQMVQMRVSIVWSDGTHFGDTSQVNLPNAGSSERHSAGGQAVTGNTVTNLAIRIQVIASSGGTIAEASPDGEGNAVFSVEGAIQSGNTIEFPAYNIRVFGPDIDETWAERVRPGQGDSMVTIHIHRKGGKKGPGGMVSVAALKIPGKAQKQFERGQKALLKNKYSAAHDYFQKAISIYPQYDAAYNALGVTLMKLNDPKGGRAAFENAIRINDKFAPAYVNLARVLGGEQQYDAAANALHRSLSIEPLNPEALSMLCQYDVLRGSYAEVPGLAQKLHSVPHDGQALGHFAAGNALEHLNRPSEAIFEYMLFLKEAPTDRLAANAKNAVERLRGQTSQANNPQ